MKTKMYDSRFHKFKENKLEKAHKIKSIQAKVNVSQRIIGSPSTRRFCQHGRQVAEVKLGRDLTCFWLSMSRQ